MKGHFCQSTTTTTTSLPVLLLLLLASSASAQVYGQNCEIIDVPEVMSRCQNYGRMEFLPSSGLRSEFHIVGGRTMYAFLEKNGGKFTECPNQCVTDITAKMRRDCELDWSIFPRWIFDNEYRDIPNTETCEPGTNCAMSMGPCEWIDLDRVREDAGCSDGTKFVIDLEENDVIQSFHNILGRSILTFRGRGTQLASCLENWVDFTPDIRCTTVPGANKIALAENCNPTTSTERPINQPPTNAPGTCQTVKKKPCKFPFTQDGVSYYSCAFYASSVSVFFWCATEVGNVEPGNTVVDFGYCEKTACNIPTSNRAWTKLKSSSNPATKIKN